MWPPSWVGFATADWSRPDPMGSLALKAANDQHADAAAVDRMLRAAPHRGPATKVVSCGGVALGVANVPGWVDSWICERDGRAAALSGTLDNRLELAAELAQAGATPVGDDPAELVLAAFRHWGEAALPRLRGTFVGAVTDGRATWAFRDQLGSRSLFHRRNGCGFLAASEAKQVAAGADMAREPDLDAVTDIFYGRLDGTRTAVRGVERFPRASVGRIDPDGALTVRRYWDPRALLETSDAGPEEALERFIELLEQAAQRMVTGNDALGLSGGIDSPTVAAFAAPRHLEMSGRPLQAVSAVFPHLPAVDEREYIEQVTALLGLPLDTYVPSARPLDDVERWVDLLDGPIDSMSIPEVAESYRRARAGGARTMMTGELAEYVYEVDPHVLGHFILHGRLDAAARWLRDYRGRGRSWRRILRGLAPSLAPAFVAGRYTRLRKREIRRLPPWIDAAQVRGLGYRPDLERPARRRWLEEQVDPLLGSTASLDANDLCAAACGVHVRFPLADIDVWEHFLSLRAEVRFPEPRSKAFVRTAMRGRVPDPILDRRDKTAFNDHGEASTDYETLRRLLSDPATRLPGVDYGLLRERLRGERLDAFEASWANDLAYAHAYLGLFV
jgi:asparagine synthase (glutamine-hydrolysing)